MRTFFVFFGLLILQPALHSQTCLPFDELEEREGMTTEELEGKYGTEIDSVMMGSVDIPEGTMPAYREFVRGLGQHLADTEELEWDSTVRYFQRIYFEPDGKAAYYLYAFRRNGFEGSDRERFEEAVEKYLAENPFDVEQEGRMAMCAPVVLKPPKGE